jgi:hypothetical protein
MQASSCSSVSERLYLFEATLKRARQCRCRNERGSLGFTQRRRNCLLPCNTNHTQSPQRPLLGAGSRHFPDDARNGQPRHPGRRGTARRHSAFLLLETLGVGAFTIRDLTLVSAQLFTGLSAHLYIASYRCFVSMVEPGVLRLTPTADGFSVGNVTGSSRRAGPMISDVGCGGDTGRRGSVRVLADFVFAQSESEEQALGASEQLACLDFVFAPMTLSQTYC